MPILFRDTSSTESGPRTPHWLEGLKGLYRAGEFLFMEEPIFLPADLNAITWHKMPNEPGWEVAVCGDAKTVQYARARLDVAAAIVLDGHGRKWLVPEVVDQEGSCKMTLSWGRDEAGVCVRVPSEEQAKLLTIADAVRREMVATQFKTTPVGVLASWVVPALAALYHFPEDAFYVLGLLDDVLALGVALAIAGFPKALPAEAEEAVAHGG